MASKMVFMYASAHPIKQKLTTLGQEVVRRMRNTSTKVKTSERVKILQRFIQKLKLSRYPEAMRKDIVKSGLRGYYRLLELEIAGKRKVNRSAEVDREKRDARKVLGPSNWFRKEKEEEDSERNTNRVGGGRRGGGKDHIQEAEEEGQTWKEQREDLG